MKFHGRIILIALILLQLPLSAQNVILTPQEEPVVPPSVRSQLPPPPPSRMTMPDTPYRLGPVVFHTQASFSYIIAEGLPNRGVTREDSHIRRLSLGITADLTDNWTLSYRPSWVSYSSGSRSDSFDQSVTLAGSKTFQASSLQFGQSYSVSRPTLVETGTQSKQESWSTELGYAYRLSAKTGLQTSLGMNERNTAQASNTRSWNVSGSLSYAISPKLSLNIGPSYSYVQIEDSPDYTTESYTAGLAWHPLGKLSFSFGTGIQRTQSQADTNGRDFSNPTYSGSATYHIFDTTTLTLSGSRAVSPSYFSAQVNDSLRWNFGLSQRLLGRLFLNLGYGQSNSEYASIVSGAPTSREDRVETFHASLSTRLLHRFSASLTFQDTENKSNSGTFSFSSKQYGIQLSYHY